MAMSEIGAAALRTMGVFSGKPVDPRLQYSHLFAFLDLLFVDTVTKGDALITALAGVSPSLISQAAYSHAASLSQVVYL